MPIRIYGRMNSSLSAFDIDESAVIWRYFDIGKFLNLITSGSLWFTRVSELQKTDPFEGSLTERDRDFFQRVVSAQCNNDLNLALKAYGYDSYIELFSNFPEKSVNFRKLLILTKSTLLQFNALSKSASCWHENKDESDAMWSLYSSKNVGIAVKSSVAHVISAFQNSERDICIGRVLYDTNSSLSALTSGIYDSILVKRHAFKHENEVRIIAHTPDGFEAKGWTKENQIYNFSENRNVPTGVLIKCKIDDLIDEIVMSPLMPEHTYLSLLEIIRKYTQKPIRRSRLMNQTNLEITLQSPLKEMWIHYIKTGHLSDESEI